MTAAKNHVTTGRRSCAGASNSTGIPKKPAIDFHHSSGGALSKSKPRASSFVVDRVQPKWIDRFRRESATQQLQTNRAAIASFATPGDTVAGTQFRQWNSTSGTKKFSVHAGMMSQTRRAVDRAAGGAS